MKNTYYFGFSILALLFFGNLTAQTKFIEKVERKGSELVIAYEKYQLSNGLTIVVHEDHSDPIVYVDVTYHVGSASEQEGRSGFAHFFEHMMFQGSEHIADEQHFKIVTEIGGTLNGSTSSDRTNYWEVLPSNQLETAFWLESDRMGFFLDSVTQKKFEVQRATVKNERGQRYDNRPYGLVGEKLDAALFPSSHPYSWQTIGYVEDLNRVNVEDLKKFFLRWYGPNNATLTVSGDVDAKEVVKLAEKYFGVIPRGPEVKPQTLPTPKLTEDRYISYEDNIRAPQLTYAFPSVPSRHPDEAPLDVLADILSGGKSSIFYQSFVKTQKAQFAVAYNPTQELAGKFMIYVRTFPDNNLAEMDSMVREGIKAFEKRGVTDDDLAKFKAGYETGVINSLSSVKGKGTMLAAYQTYTNNPNYLKAEIEKYMGVTKEDVIRVYNQYIKNQHAVIVSVVAKGESNKIARPDTYITPQRDTVAAEGAEYKNLTYKRTKDTLDRTKQPSVPPAGFVKAPDYWTKTFDNNLKVIGALSTEVPSTTLRLTIEAGHRFENKSKSGLAALTTTMLNESTMEHSTEEIGELLERLGSHISFSHNGQDIVMSVSSLTKNIDATIALAEEMLFDPKFDNAEFERAKKQQLESISNQSTKAPTIAGNTYAKLLYGKEHIMAIPAIGTESTVSKLTLDDIKDYYANRLSPKISSLVIVGDLKQEEVISKLDFLKSWKAKTITKPVESTMPNIDSTVIYFVNKDNAPQSEIRIGYMALPFDIAGKFYKVGIMNYVLGGAFNSRINLNLRELHSYTYGAKSRFSGNKFTGAFTAYASVRADATDSSVVEFMNEITNYVTTGITEDELVFTKNSIGQSEALKYETAGQKAGFIKRILDYELDPSYIDKQKEILSTISTSEINKLAKEYLPYNKMIIVVVGDKTSVYEPLTKLGYRVVELDD